MFVRAHVRERACVYFLIKVGWEYAIIVSALINYMKQKKSIHRDTMLI